MELGKMCPSPGRQSTKKQRGTLSNIRALRSCGFGSGKSLTCRAVCWDLIQELTMTNRNESADRTLRKASPQFWYVWS